VKIKPADLYRPTGPLLLFFLIIFFLSSINVSNFNFPLQFGSFFNYNLFSGIISLVINVEFSLVLHVSYKLNFKWTGMVFLLYIIWTFYKFSHCNLLFMDYKMKNNWNIIFSSMSLQTFAVSKFLVYGEVEVEKNMLYGNTTNLLRQCDLEIW